MSDQNTTAGHLPAGTQVRVSNGVPRPPQRFKRKLAEWNSANYDGVIVEWRDRTYASGYSVQHVPACGWTSDRYWMVILSSGLSANCVAPIPGAPLLPVYWDGVTATVDTAAIKAALAQAA